MPAEHWVHDLDPVLVHLPGGFAVSWYGVSYLVGMLVGGLIIWRWARRGRLPIAPEQVESFAVAGCIGIVLGGRLGYCLFYEPALWTTVHESFPWWGVLEVHKGGMASHGGLIGMTLGVWWWCRRQRISMLVMGDAVAAVAGFGVACGRVANFINGELWGRPSDVAWAVIFPHAPRVDGFDVPRHPSQLYAVGLEGLLVFAVAMLVHLRHRRPGLTIGAAMAAYGIGRFVGEFFREPDAGQPGGVGGGAFILGFMSKGQALTLPVLAIGIAILIWAWRRGPRETLYLRPAPPAA